MPEAGAATGIPQITDIPGDARLVAVSDGTNVPQADILEAWFTDTATTLTTHMRVAQMPRHRDGILLVVGADTRAHSSNDDWPCLATVALYPSAPSFYGPFGFFYDRCNGTSHLTSMRTRRADDGTAVVSLTSQRKWSPLLGSGATLVRTQAWSYKWVQATFAGYEQILDTTEEGHSFGLTRFQPEDLVDGQGRCRDFRPLIPRSTNMSRRDALKAPVIEVTDRATRKDPLVVTYEQGAAANAFVPFSGVSTGQNYDYFNLQIRSREDRAKLHTKLSWETPSTDEFDLYLYDSDGNEVVRSTNFNLPSEEAIELIEEHVYDDYGARTGPGFEYIHGHLAARCEGFTLEVDNHRTLGAELTLEVWLEDPS